MTPEALISILVVVSNVVALISAGPQLRKLSRTRHSHSFSLLSWSVWGGNQMVGVAYAYSIKAWLLVLLGIGWVVFYSVMLWMIIEYRKPGKGKK